MVNSPLHNGSLTLGLPLSTSKLKPLKTIDRVRNQIPNVLIANVGPPKGDITRVAVESERLRTKGTGAIRDEEAVVASYQKLVKWVDLVVDDLEAVAPEWRPRGRLADPI